MPRARSDAAMAESTWRQPDGMAWGMRYDGIGFAALRHYCRIPPPPVSCFFFSETQETHRHTQKTVLCRVPLKEDDDETRRAPTRFAVPLLPSSSPRACKPPRGSSEIKPAGRDRKGSHQHCSSASECEGVKRKTRTNQAEQVQSFEVWIDLASRIHKLQVTDQLLRGPEQVLQSSPSHK